MPSLRKLSLHPTNLMPKAGKELTVFGTSVSFSPNSDSMSSEISMDYSSALDLHYSDNGGISDSSSSPHRARKRERLDHLSQEEKLMRRKIKNRVAAQSARDRKKAKMTELEEQVAQLEKQKKYLLRENAELRNKTSKLETENTDLRLRLNLSPLDSIEKEDVTDVKEETKASQIAESQVEVGGSIEYAEGTGSHNSCTFDDAIRLLASNSETDALLDILQQYSTELLHDDFSNAQLENREPKRVKLSDEEMVGTTSKGMESIKELILFDHIYHKQDSDSPARPLSSPPSPVVEESEVIEVETSELNSDDFVVPSNILLLTQPPKATEIIPVIHIEETGCSATPLLPGNVRPCGTYEVTFIEDTSLPSPSVSDAGYDSAFSALSPCSEIYTTTTDCLDDEPWDDSFKELFPSLV